MEDTKRIKLDSAMMSSTMYPILSDDLIQMVPLIEVYIDQITNPKTTSRVVVELNSCLPIPELTHLKRVRSGEILLFPVENIKIGDVHNYLRMKGFDSSLLANSTKVVSVAKIPPKTKKQYMDANKYWPCNFHSDKYIEKLLANSLFTVSEMRQHEEYMKIAFKVAEYVRQNGLSLRNNGVVIIDPKIKSIVAVGYSNAEDNPIKHAPMVAVDNVARTQNGGAWNPIRVPEKNSETDLNMSGIPSNILTYLQDNFCHLTFGASWFKAKADIEEPTEGPYLCTDYYVYSTHEPCIMCAMSLIHSRVKRVFYSLSSSNGGLGSLCKIHTLKDLNHHYEVFAGLYKENLGDLE